VFELISAVVHYFAGGVQSDAASAIGFVCLQADATSILS